MLPFLWVVGTIVFVIMVLIWRSRSAEKYSSKDKNKPND
jgi:hypothetical protein